MAIADNSYGSVDEVAALTRRYTNKSAAYDATTTPTITQVEKFIDRLSGRLNVMLAEAGFVTPVSQPDAKLALDDFVVTEVVDYCHWVNSAGRFMNTKRLRGKTPAAVVDGEAADFIQLHAVGFSELGATRTRKLTYGMTYRDTDDNGDTIKPMFQRSAFNWTIR